MAEIQTLDDLIQFGATSAEKCIRDSMALDYAWLKDLRSIRNGEPAKELDAWIDERLEELTGGADSGTNP